MTVIERLRKASNHGVNYFFGHRPGTTRAKPAAAAMPPSGSDHPPATSPAPNESIVLRQGGQIQEQYGILGPNSPTGPGPVSGTDIATLDQNVAAREVFEPVLNPPGIQTVSTIDWFGPLQPLRPAAPQGTEPRRFEYVLGQNIIFEPRANEAIAYQTLRAMADATDLMRMVIETVKNEMKRSQWEINAPIKIGETRGQRKKREEADPIIGEIKTLLRHPDGIHPWETFAGEIMEDMLVIDAPAVLVRRTPDGKKVKNLIPVNGATITRYINTSGLTPIYDPNCTQPGHALLGRKQAVKGAQVCDCAAYAQYLYGVNAINLTTRDLVYMPYNMRTHKLYGYSPVEQIVVAINLYLRREMALLSYYTEGNIPEMIGFLPNTVTTEQVKEFEQWFNSVNRGDPAFMRRVRFVPNPSPTGDPKFVELKQHLLADGIDEWLIRMVAYAFNVPPTQLVRMHARAATESMSDESQVTGLEAYQKWFEALMNHIIECQMGYTGYRFKFRPTREADLLKQRQADQLMAKSGGMTLNEWREAEGLEPYDTNDFPDADRPLIFTPQGYVVVDDGGVQAGGEKPNTRSNPNNQGDSAHQAEPPPGMGKIDFPTVAVAGSAPHTAELRMRESLKRIFGLQKSAIERALLQKAQDDIEKRLWLAIASYYSLLPESVSGALKQAAVDAALEAATEAGASAARAVESFTPAQQYAQERAAEMVGMRRTAGGTLVENPDARRVITDTTRNEIRQAVADALSGKLRTPAGEPLPLAESIRRSLLDTPGGPFSDYRAGLIARTEVKNARSFGKMDTWKRLGVKATTWRTSGDERVCPMCAMNEGVTRPLGKPFPSGYVSIADSHPNCRCVQV
ncbi:MAG TPA: phage portal protein, partial [Terriglobales bacterium]|nr:phage portal protein [Terriglobales bacterium]